MPVADIYEDEKSKFLIVFNRWSRAFALCWWLLVRPPRFEHTVNYLEVINICLDQTISNLTRRVLVVDRGTT